MGVFGFGLLYVLYQAELSGVRMAVTYPLCSQKAQEGAGGGMGLRGVFTATCSSKHIP